MNGPTQAGGVARTRFGELASEALRYWEPRRLAYNLVLFAVVLAHFITMDVPAGGRPD